jgi:hypothetical protein
VDKPPRKKQSKTASQDGSGLGDHFSSAAGTDISRHDFISGIGRAGGAVAAAGVIGPATLAGASAQAGDDYRARHRADKCPFKDGHWRRRMSYRIRHKAALAERFRPVIYHHTNGDEERYPNRIGNFSKTLPHDPVTGEVESDAYKALLNALRTARFEDFEAVPAGMGGGLANPLGALAFNIDGPDKAAVRTNPPPALASAEFAAQLGELYWMACLRDVPFSQYDSDPVALTAQADLSQFSGYTGPSTGGVVEPQDLFRTDYPGVCEGPLVSQFLYRPFRYDGISIEPKIDTPAQEDFMTDFTNWLIAQNGGGGFGIPVDGTTVYPRTARDLGKIAGSDTISSAYFRAMLIFGFRGPTDFANPYNAATRQFPLATFGLSHLVELISKVQKGERHAWFQKWYVHRFLRPEAAGGCVHRVKVDGAPYPIHSDLIHRSSVLDCIYDAFDSYLLPQMFRNGSPSHPSFTAGHAISAGACVTLLKAWYNEDAEWPFEVVEPTPDGQSLVEDYDGPPLTVGGELNKLAHNLSFGRDMSGVHWRADNIEGNRQGEEVAIRILREERETYPEPFEGFSLTKFDGTTITV